MIEINLLPSDLRQVEGTPPARLGLLIILVALGLVSGFLVVLHQMKSADMRIANTSCDNQIKTLQEQEKKVVEIKAKRRALAEKIAALENLDYGRVRWWRILDRMCDAVPDGVWFRSFMVAKESGSGSARAVPGQAVGQRYRISLAGFATGGSAKEMDNKLAEVVNNLRERLNVPAEGSAVAPGQPAPPKFDEYLGLRFDRISPQSAIRVNLPRPVGTDLDAQEGLDFKLALSFELPPPKLPPPPPKKTPARKKG